MDLNLSGKFALITGGLSGIGAASALAFARAGADVALIDRNPGKGADVVSAIEGFGRKAVLYEADVSSESDIDRAFDAAIAALGAPRILLNSAGVNMAHVAVADMTAEAWRLRINTDLTGCFLSSRRFVRECASTGGGRIINITSIHADVMRAGGAAYDAAKGGVANLTKTMALETAARNITVNAIAPGMILTPMNERALDDDAYRKELEANIPAGRAGRPEEVAGVALFLASEAAGYITGATITIDGGLSLLLGQGA
jgi:glucose 1-dehydrogenase